MIPFPQPADLGLDPKFQSWWPGQAEAIVQSIDAPTRFSVQCMPTGSGKTVMYVTQALLHGGRAVILTSTKGLQDQVKREHKAVGLVDIRGKNAYPCRGVEEGMFDVIKVSDDVSCEEGPCHAGIRCGLKDAGCRYYDQIKVARIGGLVSTNYKMWLTINKYGEGLGNFDLIVLDEAHNVMDEVAGFLATEIEEWEIGYLTQTKWPKGWETQEEWRNWAGVMLMSVRDKLQSSIDNAAIKPTKDNIKKARRYRDLERKLESVAGMRGEWIWEEIKDNKGARKWRFDPVWPAHYVEKVLLRGIRKVVVVSATVTAKTMELVGVAQPDYSLWEWPSKFPVDRRPVIWVPTTRVDHNSSPLQMVSWVDRIDQIIGARRDRKGIIHTVSYARAKFLQERSEHKHLMMMHDTRNTAQVVEEFKRSEPPMVLVSPSVTTGWDFPYDQCEYQIIGKIPFPDRRSKVLQARTNNDKDWSNYVAMQTLVQMCGRGMRAGDDRCECLIVDDHAEWFVRKAGRFAPKWWMEAYKPTATIPSPPPKL